MIKAYTHLVGASLTAAVFAAETADKALSQVPCYRSLRVRVLDSLFGPEEHFEFAGHTTPPIT